MQREVKPIRQKLLDLSQEDRGVMDESYVKGTHWHSPHEELNGETT